MCSILLDNSINDVESKDVNIDETLTLYDEQAIDLDQIRVFESVATPDKSREFSYDQENLTNNGIFQDDFKCGQAVLTEINADEEN